MPFILVSCAHEPIKILCILITTISIIDIPATKITGLKTSVIRLGRLKSFPIPFDVSILLGLKRSIRIKKGVPIIKTRRSPILMIFAITNNNSATVKKKISTNLNAKVSDSVTAFQSLPILMVFWNWKIPIPI
jgi:hypothetical protein